MIIFKIIICLLCLLWIFLAIIKQFKPAYFNRNVDPFSLIPIWTLFSPRPMKNTSLVGYREVLQNGEISEIILINNFIPQWYYTFWYGQRRDVKYILGVKRELLGYKRHKDLFVLSSTFQILKKYTLNYKNEQEVKERQLVFFTRGGFFISKKDELLLVTNIKLD